MPVANFPLAAGLSGDGPRPGVAAWRPAPRGRGDVGIEAAQPLARDALAVVCGHQPEQHVAQLPEVVVADMAAYDTFYKHLIETVPLKNVTSRFAMERIKHTTALPLAFVRLH